MISSVPHIIPPVKKIRVDILFKRSKIEYSVSEYVRKLSSEVIWGTTKDMNFHPIVVEKKKKILNAQVARAARLAERGGDAFLQRAEVQ